MALFQLVLCFSFLQMALAKGSEPQVECTPEVMKVSIPMDGDREMAYLDQLKLYSPCQPVMEGKTAVFMLDLQDHHKCGVTRVLNSLTGKRTFYHKVVIESALGGRETVTARCVVTGKVRLSRSVEPFPLDFKEPDVLNITRYEEGRAPEPVLGAVVKQNGKQVSGEISVSPGTPLSMEIFLDNTSAPVYGLLVSYMYVTDTGKQQEPIVFNGCSVDPYLFDNFLTSDGDNLMAKFRAFKFPDTTFVQFKGTVYVCLDKCQGVLCSNGVTAYGRKRRSVATGAASNKIYEVSLTTFIKVDWEKGHKMTPEDELALIKNLKVENQLLGERDGTPATVAERTQDNKLVLHNQETSHANMVAYSFLIILACVGILLK
ncbi:uncharacterized protein qsm [Epargyreus clarus]|uniref:uncharacterized protein qsm n=1 Tax=Epargyreus clarus TaxID=520877 RepID=UPI003C2E6B82